MTAPLLETDPYDVSFALRSAGVLRTFNEAEVINAADVHVARTVGRLGGELDESVLLAVAVAVRAVRQGSVCVALDEVAAVQPELPWPADWLGRVAASPLVGETGPLRIDLCLLYLDRYWRQEVQVCADLLERAAEPPPPVDDEALRQSLDALFAADPAGAAVANRAEPEVDRQRLAVEAAVRRWITVVGGGPGTGKTTTIARLLAALTAQPGPRPRIALAAPTGKAAARMQEAIQAADLPGSAAAKAYISRLSASTMHRLLGPTGNSGRFRHHRNNRLPYDVVILDETSMVSLTLMARLLDALRPHTRLVLVGDPDQLASVEAGAVLADLVAGLSGAPAQPSGAVAPGSRRVTEPERRGSGSIGPADTGSADTGWAARGAAPVGVVLLQRRHRFGGAIALLADAVRAGRSADALEVLHSGEADVTFTERADQHVRADVVEAAEVLRDAAVRGAAADALRALDRHRLLCAHRTGPFGVEQWTSVIERWLAEARGLSPAAAEGQWYLGRPLLVTANDDLIGVYNGDAGVVIAGPAGEPRVVFGRGSGAARFAPSRLPVVQTMHAMTVHRSQGSQFERVTLVLPEPDSPLLTRELLYTALTRAQSHVRIVGTEEAFTVAVARRAARASGLRERLTGAWAGDGAGSG